MRPRVITRPNGPPKNWFGTADWTFTIFRPSLIYGPQDQFINLFARIIRLSPVVPLLGSPRARFQPVPVEAVAAAFAGSLGEPKSVGQTYDLCGPEALTLSEIVDRIHGGARAKGV